MIKGIGRTTREGDEEHWISVSDLMSGLMVIFLFVAISYIRPVIEQRNLVKEIAVTWQQSETKLYEALVAEFESDLPRWGAEIDKETLSIRFKSPDILFESGRADLRPAFREILNDFFPRYVRVLAEFRDAIDEVRIEGHTSSEWTGTDDQSQAYFKNMALSQERTRAVLEYCLTLSALASERDWAVGHITANGLASSRLVVDPTGAEDKERSRRVEFRIKTNAKQQIVRILEAIE